MRKRKGTYNVRDLCDRYSCSLLTIHRREREQGYPTSEKYGRDLIWSEPKVTAWEKIHMPGLHSAANEEAATDEDWDEMHRERVEPVTDEPPPAPKPKPKKASGSKKGKGRKIR